MPVNGKSFSSPLPPVYDSGVVMSVKRGASVLNVSVQNTIQSNDKFTLLVHTGQKLGFIGTLQRTGLSEGFSVPLTQLGDGISHLTLFDAAGRPMCERLFFKKPGRLLDVNVSTDKAVYPPREKVIISLEQSSNGQPVSGDFSVAVYRVDSVGKRNGDIASALWLTSELKGNVEDPAWYLDNPYDDSTDDLILTHGWRRFKWDDILGDKKQDIHHLPELEGHIISGRITNAESLKPVDHQVAFLSIPDRRLQFYTALSDSNGLVNFYTKDFRGATEIILQTDPRRDSLLRLEINSPFSTYFTDPAKGRFNMYPNNQELLLRSVAMQVNNIYQSTNLNRERVEPIDSAAFYVRPDRVYKLDDYVRFTTMEEVLREYVSEVLVTLKNKSYRLKMLSLAIGTFHNQAPLILIDGVPVFDEGNAVIQIDPMNIRRIELVNDAYVYGHNVFSGILSLHSYKGDLGGFKLPPRAAVADYDGMQNVREFYSPMYPGDTNINSRIPDYRTTLFWSPDTKADKDGKAILELSTSDLDGKYQIVVQSLSADGAAGSKVVEFHVRRNDIN